MAPKQVPNTNTTTNTNDSSSSSAASGYSPLVYAAVVASVVGLGYVAYKVLTKETKVEPPKPSSKSTTTATDAKPSKQKIEEKQKVEEKQTSSTTTTPSPAAAPTDEAVKPISEMTREERIERANYLKTRGNKFYTAQQFEKAVKLYTEAIEVYPEEDKNVAIFYANRAACYANQNKIENVIEDCTSAVRIHPQYAKAYSRRGQVLEKQENFKEALFDYTAACFIESFEKADSRTACDRVLRTMSKNLAAERIKTKQPSLPSFSHIAAYLNAFRLQPAIEILQKNDADLSDGDKQLKQALTLIQSKRYEEVLPLLEEALKLGTSYAEETKLWKGTFLYLYSRLEESLRDLQDIADNSTNVSLKVNALIKKASIHLEKGGYEDPAPVINDFDAAVQLDPNDSDIYYHRGQLFFLVGNVNAAIDDYKKSVQLCDKVPLAQAQLALGLYRTGSVQEALDNMKTTMTKFPNLPDLHNYMGEMYLDQKEFAKALAMFDKAIELEPSNPLSYVNKAMAVYMEKQNAQDAITLVQKALEVDKNCDVAYAHIAQLHLQLAEFDKAIDAYESAVGCCRTEIDMANMISCREFADAQLQVLKKIPGVKPPALPGMGF